MAASWKLSLHDCRYASDQRMGGNITSDYGTRSNYGTIANANAGQDDTFGSNPAAVPDHDRARGSFARTSLLRAKLVAANDEFNTWSQVTATADPDICLLMGMKDHSGAEPGAFTDDQAPSAVDPSAPAKLDVRLHLYTRCAQKSRSGSKQPGGWEERQNNVD
ncbi:hypothetical protein BB029_11770 [Pseudomonas sp. S3E12]|nr:hypothetical protein BB029_11770 [Pseudomonas sp. S3E12]